MSRARGHREPHPALARATITRRCRPITPRIRTFPDAIGAKIFYGAKPKVPFEAAAGAQEAPEVDFNTAGYSDDPFPGRLLWLAVLLAASAGPCARHFPKLTAAPVVDQADLLSRRKRPSSTAKSEAARRRTGRQFVDRDGPQPRRADDRGLWLPARRHWGIGDEQNGRRRHPAGRAQRAKGPDRDRLWRARLPDRRRVEQ